MADLKTYLNVPYAQKDEAKALGARWDAANKKWYVPADKDLEIFAKWRTQSANLESPPLQPISSKVSTPAKKSTTDAITRAADKSFVAYEGDEPPWI